MSITRRKFLTDVSAGSAAFAIPSARGFSIAPDSGQPSSAAAVPSPDHPLRLGLNESAFGPSPKVAEILKDMSGINDYPDVAWESLRDEIAGFHRVSREQVVLGCGSSEILRAVTAVLLDHGKKLIMASPTYELMAEEAQNSGAQIERVPLNHEYGHDLNAMLARTADSAGVVYICNPNNPTGSLTFRKNLEDFLLELPPTFTVVIDEAYHHYVDETPIYSSFIDHPVDNPRLIVTRTFSHIYALAGARVGYAITSPDLARKISSRCLRFNLNAPGAQAAIAALRDVAYVHDCSERNRNIRQEFLNQVNARMLRCIDPHANFVFLNANRPATEVIDFFIDENILIGPAFPSMGNYIRVSLGTPAEMVEFWRAWSYLSPKMDM
jgi:histidinol-phosphate aminotransferase